MLGGEMGSARISGARPVSMGLLALAGAAALVLLPVATASHTPNPTAVTIAGSLQSELGCSGDWESDCAASHLTYDGADDVWQRTFALPAGSFEYKAPLNDSWTENYGLHAQQDGPNIPLNLAAGASVKFYYDHKSHWVTDNRSSVIAVAPGSFQSELGCPGDWDPSCLRSWLQDAEGDGIYSFETTALPAGSYEGKVAINESWNENYGAGGVPGGDNIAFTVPANDAKVSFTYNATTHVLTVTAASPTARTASAPPETRLRRSGTRSRTACSATSTTRRSTTRTSRRSSTSLRTARRSRTCRRGT
jgi:Pullulanase X25 domain